MFWGVDGWLGDVGGYCGGEGSSNDQLVYVCTLFYLTTPLVCAVIAQCWGVAFNLLCTHAHSHADRYSCTHTHTLSGRCLSIHTHAHKDDARAQRTDTSDTATRSDVYAPVLLAINKETEARISPFFLRTASTHSHAHTHAFPVPCPHAQIQCVYKSADSHRHVRTQ